MIYEILVAICNKLLVKHYLQFVFNYNHILTIINN